MIIIPDYTLTHLNAFRFHYKAQFFCRVTDIEMLRDAVVWAQSHRYGITVIGGGSNILLQGNISGLVIHMDIRGRTLSQLSHQTVELELKAGENWHQSVAFSVEQGLYGIENLALIPGSCGAAPVQNIGAYGVELANVLTAVQVFDRHTHHVIWLPASDCAFGYRESHFKNTWSTRYIICAIRLQLALQPIIGVRYAGLADLPDDATSMAIFERVCFIRQQKLPDPMLLANAGSFFKNPIVSQATYLQLQASYPDVVAYPVEDLWKIAAGWLIEKAGWKGFCKDEQVGVYNKQALVLVNYQATTSDLLLWLQKTITDDIYNRFGICLEREPALLGQPPP